MDKDERVVVAINVEVYTNQSTGRKAARILELGLTAYGQTQEEATQKVKRMYTSAVQAHRELGTLKDWLDRSGLQWHWADES